MMAWACCIAACDLPERAATLFNPQRAGTLGAPHAAPVPPAHAVLTLLPGDLPPGTQQLRLGITPYDAPDALRLQFQALAAHLTKTLGIPVVLHVAPTYAAMLDEVSEGRVDLALLSPLSYVLARRRAPGLELLARTLSFGATDYASFIVVRADSPATRLGDLRGRRVAGVDALSTAGFLFPFASFLDHGVDPDRDLKLEFAGTHAAALAAVVNGKADAAAISSGTIASGQDLSRVDLGEVRILYKAGRIPYDAVCARPGLPASGTHKIAWAFQGVDTRTRHGREVLARAPGLTGWIQGQDAAYDGVRRVLERYEAHRGTALAPPDVVAQPPPSAATPVAVPAPASPSAGGADAGSP